LGDLDVVVGGAIDVLGGGGVDGVGVDGDGKPVEIEKVGDGVAEDVVGTGVNVGLGFGTLPSAAISCLVAIGRFRLPAR
jgi:hypothetical protein